MQNKRIIIFIYSIRDKKYKYNFFSSPRENINIYFLFGLIKGTRRAVKTMLAKRNAWYGKKM